MKLLELIQKTTDYFTKQGVDSPRLTIELMLAELLQKTRMQLYLEFEREMTSEELDRLRPWVKKRTEGHPLQHLTGHTTFDGHRFKVTPDVLIPRPETEFLLEEAIKRIAPDGAPVLDVGTGSGILAVSIARRFPSLQVHAIDISPAALCIAKENAGDLQNITFHEGDLLAVSRSSLPDAFQGIVSNLPYIPTEMIPNLSKEVQHDPVLALDGGVGGVDLIRLLIAQSKGKTPWIGLEIGDGQAQVVEDCFIENGFATVKRIKDLSGVERIVFGQI